MTDIGLDSLLAGLETETHHARKRDRAESASGTVVVVSCSMSHCQYDLSVWPVDPSWDSHRLPTLGTQTWVRHDGELDVDDSLTHITATHTVEAVLVVGHTGCEVLADAYEQCLTSSEPSAAGIAARLDPLVSLAADAVDAGVVEDHMSLRQARHHLVEYNVVRQVEFLTERLPSSITVVGYVHDEAGVYGSFPDTQYLVSVDGHTDAAELTGRLPDEESTAVGRLCH